MKDNFSLETRASQSCRTSFQKNRLSPQNAWYTYFMEMVDEILVFFQYNPITLKAKAIKVYDPNWEIIL